MSVTAPNTTNVANAIQAIIQNLTIAPVNGIAGYNTVSIGAKKDVTNLLPLLEITTTDDKTQREGMGGIGNSSLIADEQYFQLMTTVDYTDSTTGELVMYALRDALTQAFHSSASLQGTAGVIGVWLEDTGKYGYAFRNGVWCRIHHILLRVGYYYETTMEA